MTINIVTKTVDIKGKKEGVNTTIAKE